MGGDLGDIAMLAKRRLDLEARDILAAAAEVVLLAVDVVEEALFVDAAHVAGVQPEILDHCRGRIRAVPIALEHDAGPVRPHADLAGGAARTFLAVVVEDADVEGVD